MEGQGQGISFLSTSSEKGSEGTGPGLYRFKGLNLCDSKEPATTNEWLCDSSEDHATAAFPEVQEAQVGVFYDQTLI